MSARIERLRERVGAVPDPEIPVMTLADLGILRDVREEDGQLVVELTPTFSGCPATAVIAADVRAVLAAEGETRAEVRIVLSPAWTTDWIGPEAREKLRRHGIAPPGRTAAGGGLVRFASEPGAIRCPRCGSAHTEALSDFGSTPCKALYRCLVCREPFDWFKTH